MDHYQIGLIILLHILSHVLLVSEILQGLQGNLFESVLEIYTSGLLLKCSRVSGCVSFLNL